MVTALQSLIKLCACALSLTVVAAQSQGPFEREPPGRPVSAQQYQLTGDDPTGRGAVLVRVPCPRPRSLTT